MFVLQIPINGKNDRFKETYKIKSEITDEQTNSYKKHFKECIH